MTGRSAYIDCIERNIYQISYHLQKNFAEKKIQKNFHVMDNIPYYLMFSNWIIEASKLKSSMWLKYKIICLVQLFGWSWSFLYHLTCNFHMCWGTNLPMSLGGKTDLPLPNNRQICYFFFIDSMFPTWKTIMFKSCGIIMNDKLSLLICNVIEYLGL